MSHKKIIGLIQARMGSMRLPGKVMMPLAGKPLIWHLFKRLMDVNGLNGIILATTMDERNDELVAFAESEGIQTYRESNEDDIASRLVGAAHDMNADAILKINGDCPIADIQLLNEMVDRFHDLEKVDYLSNKVKWSYPKGLSAEIISVSALRWCKEKLSAENDRELVCDWIRDHPDRFVVFSHEYRIDISKHNWMVDTQEDYVFMSGIFNDLYKDNEKFGLREVLNWLSR